MRNLRTILVAKGQDLTDWVLSEALAISDDGLTIAGNGTNPSGESEAWIATLSTAVPSFAGRGLFAITAILMLIGALMLSGWGFGQHLRALREFWSLRRPRDVA